MSSGTAFLGSNDRTVTINDATRAEEIAIRDAVGEFYLVAGNGHGRPRFHLPGTDGEPRCGGRTTQHLRDREFEAKATTIYPVGYHDLCKHCVDLWRSLPVVAGGEADG